MSYKGSVTNRPMKSSPEEHKVGVVPPLPSGLQHVEVATVLVEARNVDLPGKSWQKDILNGFLKLSACAEMLKLHKLNLEHKGWSGGDSKVSERIGQNANSLHCHCDSHTV